jgi:hypothetical protein
LTWGEDINGQPALGFVDIVQSYLKHENSCGHVLQKMLESGNWSPIFKTLTSSFKTYCGSFLACLFEMSVIKLTKQESYFSKPEYLTKSMLRCLNRFGALTCTQLLERVIRIFQHVYVNIAKVVF